MSGGTLTPPRDPTWDTEALIAPVIPFRQRGEQPGQPTRDEPEASPPIVAAPADKPGSSWIHQGTDLLARHAAAAQLEDDANTTRPRPTRRRLAVPVIALAAVLAALAILPAGAPAPTRSRTRIDADHVSQPTRGSLPTGWVSGLLAAVRTARSLEASAQRSHKTGAGRTAHRAPVVHHTTPVTVVATPPQTVSVPSSSERGCANAGLGQLGC
jgi:hypothetical protein